MKIMRIVCISLASVAFLVILLLGVTVGVTTAVSEPFPLITQNKTEIQAVEAITHTIFLPIVELTRQGHGILFVSDRVEAGKYDIYSMNLDGSNVKRLTHLDIDSNVSLPRWSPDGTQIAVQIEGVLYLMKEDGSQLAPLLDDPMTAVVGIPAWSPDGTKIAYVANNCDTPRPVCESPTGGGVRIIDVSTKEITQAIPDGIMMIPDENVVWTKDGSSVWALPQESGYSGIGIGYLDNSPTEWILTDYDIKSFALSSNENKITFVTQQYFYVFDLDKNDMISSQQFVGIHEFIYEQTWHPSKDKFAYVYHNFTTDTIVVSEFDGDGWVAPPFLANRSISIWGWTLDGLKFLYTQDLGDSDIFVVDDDGNNITNLTPDSSESDDILADYRP